jgi:hypothetical protein
LKRASLLQYEMLADVACGSTATSAYFSDVRFYSESDQPADIPKSTLCANNGHRDRVIPLCALSPLPATI